MATKRATRRGCSHGAPTCPCFSQAKRIVSDFERGSEVAGWMLAGMFAFMALGSVIWGW